MAVHYFSTSGNDSNTGSEESPFLSRTKLNALIAASTEPTTILFKGGDTFNFTGEILVNGKSSTFFNSYGDGKATISFSAGTHCFNLINTTATRIDNLKLIGVTGSAVAPSVVGVKAAINVAGSSAVVVTDCQLTGSGVGVYAYNSSVNMSALDINNPYIAGVSITNGSGILSEISCYFAGVTITGGTRTANNLSILAGTFGEDKGAAVRFLGTAQGRVSGCRFVNNVRGLFNGSTANVEITIHRTFFEFGFFDEVTGLEVNGPAGSTFGAFTRVIDCVIRSGYYVAPSAKAIRVVSRLGPGEVRMQNCTIVSFNTNSGAVVFYNHPSYTSTNALFSVRNCAVAINNPSNPSADHFFVSEGSGLASGPKYQGINNNYGYAVPAPATSPFRIGATTYTRTAWSTFGRETNLQTFQFEPEAMLSITDDVGRTKPTNGIANAGLDLTSEFGNYQIPLAPIDYYGLNRSYGFSGFWSIGAHEPNPRPTVQAFTEGSSQINLTSPVGVSSYAVYQEVPQSLTFPRQLHRVETVFRYTGNLSEVGVFLLSDRIPDIYTTNIGGSPQSVIETNSGFINATIYNQTPDRSLDSTNYWRIGQTPAVPNNNRVVFRIKRIASSYYAEIINTNSGLASSSVELTGAEGLNAPPPNTLLGLKLEAKLTGDFTDTCSFSFSAWISYSASSSSRVWTPVITGFNMSLPKSYLQLAKHSGILGSRASLTDTLAWTKLSTETQPEDLSVPNSGVARYKEFMSGRESVTNLVANGGFTNYPTTVQTAVKYRPVSLFPGSPGTTTGSQGGSTGSSTAFANPVVHIGFCLDGGNYYQRSHLGYAKNILLSFIDDCPRNGSVAISLISCGDNSEDGKGPVRDHIGPDCQLTATSYTRIRQAISNITSTAVSAEAPGWLSGMGLDPNNQPGLEQAFSRQPATRNIAVFMANDRIPVHRDFTYPTTIRDYFFTRTPNISDTIVVALHSDYIYQIFSTAEAANLFNAILKPRDLTTPLVFPPVAAVDYNDAIIPNGLKSVVISIDDHYASPSPAPKANIQEAIPQIGLDISLIVKKRVTELSSVAPPPSEVIASALLPVTILTRIPGIPTSINIPAETPAESLLGEWSVSGCLGSLDINPSGPSGALLAYDGGNVARVTFSESGTIKLSQKILDIKPLLGRWITLAYSGHRGNGRVQVSMNLVIDDKEVQLDSTPSTSFGDRLRRVSSYELPLNFNTLSVVISIKGTTSASVGLSAIALALGRYEKDLPYSAGEHCSIPSGTVVMYAGSACPPGFRTVPFSKDRLALVTTSSPFELSASRSVPAIIPDSEATNVSLLILIDIGGDMYTRATMIDRIVADVIANAPRSVRTKLSVIVTNTDRPGEVSVPFTQISINPAALLTAFRAAVSSTLPGGFTNQTTMMPFKNLTAGLYAALTALNNDTSPNKLLYYVTDLSYQRTEAMLDLFNQITQVRGVYNVSCIVPFSASPVATNASDMLFPKNTPGQDGEIIVDSLGNTAAEKIISKILLALDREISEWELPAAYANIEPPYLGGQEKHDHVATSGSGAAITDSDGLEDSSSELVQTGVRIPRESAVTLKAYPYGVAGTNRAGDRPVFAVGSQHRHSFSSDMIAMPPSFPILFCEKL